MKKRFLCALLTLIMLVSLVPATALTASAAGYTTSEAAITVLKQMEGYKKECVNGYTGYGTRCAECAKTGTNGCSQEISEKQADAALRTALKSLDEAVTSFAGKNGVALSQNKHDALVLFSFENGTAWTTGTGDFKSAVVSGKTGSDFLDAICRWEISVADDNRRMIEANMYLNGAYSSSRPANFIRVSYNASQSPEYGTSFLGSLNGNSSLQYYDTNEKPVPEITPTMSNHKFLGWYYLTSKGTLELVDRISSEYHTHELIARWQANNAEDGNTNSEVYYVVKKSALADQSAYTYPNGLQLKIALPETIVADRDFIDADGYKWLRLKDTTQWVVLGKAGSYKHPASADANVVALAVVTYPGYVNVRNGAGTNNTIIGSIANNTEVKLYETKFVNGHEWGRCDIGWFCLSYAKVTRLKNDTSASDAGMLAYAFTGKMVDMNIYKNPSLDSELYFTREYIDPNVTVTHLKADAAGNTWGKIPQGWVLISDKDGNKKDVTLDIAKFAVVADSVTVRSTPSTTGSRVNTLTKGVEFNVNSSKQIVVVGETIWGYADKAGEKANENASALSNSGINGPSYNGWVNLAEKYVSRNGAPSVKEENATPIGDRMATVVNTDRVNVREYNDATYAKIGSLARGTTVIVWEEEDGWYKIDSNCNSKYDYEDDGWVSERYLNVFKATGNTTGTTTGSGTASGSVETGLGVVANTYTGVNVRTGAGTGYAQTGKILAGTTVEILEVKTAGNSKWGRVTQGWICMDYVTMVSKYPVSGSNTNASTGSSTNTTAAEPAVFTGKTKTAVTVYKTTSLSADSVRTLNAESPVTIHELLIVEDKITEDVNPETNEGSTTVVTTTKSNWARVNDGYIYSPGDCLELDALDEDTYTVTGVKNEDPLNVRATAGTGDVKDKIYEYQVVSITSLTIYNGSVWGRAEYEDEDGFDKDGWVSMKYLTRGKVNKPVQNENNTTTTPQPPVIGSTGNTGNQGTNGFVNNASGYRYTGKVIRTNSVNVRANPSQTAGLTTTLKSGSALVIYETVVNEGMAWGRCDAGWVYLYYVDLQPCNTAVDAKVVYNENTIAYTDANCSGVAGTYSRMSVVDIYEQVGSMCRTDLGWVHIDNLG